MERVLLLSMGFGSGHNAAAKALQLQFDTQPHVEAVMVDLLDFIPKSFHPLLQAGYHRMLTKFPLFYHYLYDWTYQSSVIRYVSSELIEKVGWTIRRRFNQMLKEFHPTRIVTTHPFGLLLLPSRWCRIPTVGVVTDYELHPIWMGRLPDVLCVPKKLADRKKLDRLHLQAGTRVVETGLPIHKKYYEQISSRTARAKLGLPADRPVILVMGGGDGHGPIPALVKQLQRMPQFQFVIITGSNDCLRERLIQEDWGEHIRIEGFRTDLHDWMSAADLLITKPGGVTITEAIAKNLPMLLFEAIPGQEEANKQYLLHHRVAYELHWNRIPNQIEQLFLSRLSIEQMNRSFSQISPHHAAQLIMQETLQLSKPEVFRYLT